jgi:hypothetical protein
VEEHIPVLFQWQIFRARAGDSAEKKGNTRSARKNIMPQVQPSDFFNLVSIRDEKDRRVWGNLCEPPLSKSTFDMRAMQIIIVSAFPQSFSVFFMPNLRYPDILFRHKMRQL